MPSAGEDSENHWDLDECGGQRPLPFVLRMIWENVMKLPTEDNFCIWQGRLG
jgi:hypothetical protein